MKTVSDIKLLSDEELDGEINRRTKLRMLEASLEEKYIGGQKLMADLARNQLAINNIKENIRWRS